MRQLPIGTPLTDFDGRPVDRQGRVADDTRKTLCPSCAAIHETKHPPATLRDGLLVYLEQAQQMAIPVDCMMAVYSLAQKLGQAKGAATLAVSEDEYNLLRTKFTDVGVARVNGQELPVWGNFAVRMQIKTLVDQAPEMPGSTDQAAPEPAAAGAEKRNNGAR